MLWQDRARLRSTVFTFSEEEIVVTDKRFTRKVRRGQVRTLRVRPKYLFASERSPAGAFFMGGVVFTSRLPGFAESATELQSWRAPQPR